MSTRTKTALRTLVDPIADANPLTVHVLGVCSALAVSKSLLPALIMSAAVVVVLAFASVTVSALRRWMPQSIRLIIEVTLIASAVIVVDEVLKTFAPDISSILSVFVGLIITNCIILARVDGYAMHNPVGRSLLDAIGNGLGYTWVMVVVAAARELGGAGTLLGHTVLPTRANGGWYEPNELMLLTPSAFFLIALVIWLAGSVGSRSPSHGERGRPRANPGAAR